MASKASASASAVLGQLHVSCFVTAANRATPVFDVQPDHRCVRVVTKPTAPSVHSDQGAALAASPSTQTPPTAPAETPTAEWEFHSVFGSVTTTHSSEFYREITQRAARCAVEDGINANILATGIQPTQKFRLLFGKSASATPALAETPPRDQLEVLDAHGQLGGLLLDFFERPEAPDWTLGISSWIIVNNQAVDLLQQQQQQTSDASTAPLSFVSLEATSFATALRILQTAKTHRIVRKHTAEHSHFFVRLAFFHNPTGRLSTLHLVDLMDLKDFRDAVSAQEKLEFFEILHEIRLQTSAMAAHATAARSTSPKSKLPASGGVAVAKSSKTMLLSNFLQPLLTQNARTFLYTNVIDSRASLRESVALLNAAANVKGFACVCKTRTGVQLGQLGFQAVLSPVEEAAETETEYAIAAVDSAAAKAMAAVAIGESLLHRLASASTVKSTSAASVHKADADAPLSSPAVTSNAMSWLEGFKQRKREILATTSSSPPPFSPPIGVVRPVVSTLEELPLGLDDHCHPHAPEQIAALSDSQHSSGGGGSSSNLYARLMETIEGASGIPAQVAPVTASLRMQLRRSNSMPLPIEDPVEDSPLPPPPPPAPQLSLSADLAARLAGVGVGVGVGYGGGLSGMPPTFKAVIPVRAVTLDNLELPHQAMAPPNVDGLDPSTAAKIQAADAALLRNNYDALLSVVREQQQLREAAEARADDAVHDCDELRAQYDVQIENLKLNAVALRSKVRVLEKQSGVAYVFEQYEAELHGLQRELQQLRMQNVDLELRLGSVSASASTGSGPAMASAGSLTELKKRYQTMALDKLELERQLAEFRKKERQFHAQSKLLHESTARLERLSRELSDRDDVLVSTRLGKKRLSAEIHLAQQESQQLQQENERLLLEKAATTEELLAARMYLASVESEQKKAEILDQFVKKHGDRMQRVRGGGAGGNNCSTWMGAESWRRDAQAQEAEEKLFQGVKRSVPQLVPLASRVLRKLELQELSLREFAAREVDFINLLVELASDQPARALKSMIEEEMKKLSIF